MFCLLREFNLCTHVSLSVRLTEHWLICRSSCSQSNTSFVLLVKLKRFPDGNCSCTTRSGCYNDGTSVHDWQVDWDPPPPNETASKAIKNIGFCLVLSGFGPPACPEQRSCPWSFQNCSHDRYLQAVKKEEASFPTRVVCFFFLFLFSSLLLRVVWL